MRCKMLFVNTVPVTYSLYDKKKQTTGNVSGGKIVIVTRF